MQVENNFPCQWGSCTFSFLLEADLFTHLKQHTKTVQPISCVWRGCNSTTEYKNRGHLADHVISHFSRNFVSIWCTGCLAAFRNRQSLSRHQRKSGCSGILHEEPCGQESAQVPKPIIIPPDVIADLEPAQVPKLIINPPVAKELERIPKDLIESIFDQSNMSPNILVRSISAISLNDIVDREKKGILIVYLIIRSSRRNRIGALDSKQWG
jgi:hypothetical protein